MTSGLPCLLIYPILTGVPSRVLARGHYHVGNTRNGVHRILCPTLDYNSGSTSLGHVLTRVEHMYLFASGLLPDYSKGGGGEGGIKTGMLGLVGLTTGLSN